MSRLLLVNERVVSKFNVSRTTEGCGRENVFKCVELEMLIHENLNQTTINLYDHKELLNKTYQNASKP